MILVETSAWVEFDRATDSATDRRLTELIATGGDIAVTEPVLMEVLAGAKDERSGSDLRRLLTSFGWIAAEAATDFEGAARVYRSCRRRGVTPSGLIDCMIASIALHECGPPHRRYRLSSDGPGRTAGAGSTRAVTRSRR